MTDRAHGTFENKQWDEQTVQDLGEGRITRAGVVQAFTGDLEGEGRVEWDMYYAPDGTASFVGFHRIAGTLAGKSGTIVVRTTGVFDGQEARGDWLVAGATGGLIGLRGTGEFRAPMGPGGTYALDYDV
jgi:hypothetical protein